MSRLSLLAGLLFGLALPARAQSPNAAIGGNAGGDQGGVLSPAQPNAAPNVLSPSLSPSAPDPSTLDPSEFTRAISMQGQISVIFQYGDKIGVAHDTFQDGKIGKDATPQSILRVLQETAIAGLGEAVKNGAKSGRADVTATVYQFAAEGDTIRAWAPVGVFINSTEMVLADNGQASFHTHVQFVPDNPKAPAIQAVPPLATPAPDNSPLLTPKEKPGGLPPPSRIS